MSNPLVKSVCNAMERIAPLRLAESWDNVGLLLESPVYKPEKKRVLLTIDLTSSVLSEALAKNASVIVSYHPTIFKSLKSFTLGNPLQHSLLRCAAEGISVYSPHTALDSIWGGINDWLAQGLLKDKDNGVISALAAEKLSHSGAIEGAEGRLVTLNEGISLAALASKVKSHLKISHLQLGYSDVYARQSAHIRTIAICAGSGGSLLLQRPADVYLTGEMSHHEVLAAVASGTHVILCGHTNTERGFLHVLASKLHKEISHASGDQGLGDVEVVVSQNDQHPLEIV